MCPPLPKLILALVAVAATAACAAPEQEVRTPVPEDINKSFLAEDVNVDSYAERWELESREVYLARDQIVAALGLEPGSAIADVGTGTGLYMEPLAAAVGPEGKVYAIDISPSFVFHVRERARAAGLDQVEVVLSSERSTHLPAGSVDVAYVCDVYHHFEYHEDMLGSIRRALRPGGTLVVVDFHRIPGVTREWLLGHVRAGREVFQSEIEAAGFEFVEEVAIDGFEDNYCLRFRKK